MRRFNFAVCLLLFVPGCAAVADAVVDAIFDSAFDRNDPRDSYDRRLRDKIGDREFREYAAQRRSIEEGQRN